MSTSTIPRALGSTLILTPTPAATIPLLIVVATFRDGTAHAQHRDGQQRAQYRDGIVQTGGR